MPMPAKYDILRCSTSTPRGLLASLQPSDCSLPLQPTAYSLPLVASLNVSEADDGG